VPNREPKCVALARSGEAQGSPNAHIRPLNAREGLWAKWVYVKPGAWYSRGTHTPIRA